MKNRKVKIIVLLMMFVMTLSAVYSSGSRDSGGSSSTSGNSGSSSSTSEGTTDRESMPRESGYEYYFNPDGSFDHREKIGGGPGGGGSQRMSVRSFFSSLFSFVKSFCSAVGSAISMAFNAVVTGITKAVTKVVEVAKTVVAKVVGDPVLLTTGKYIQNDTDISLKTLTGSVNINRYYISSHGTSGKLLGSEWILSTEERLVRGYTEGADGAASEIEAAVSALSNSLNEAEEAWKTKDQYEPDAAFEAEFEAELSNSRTELANGRNAAANYRATADRANRLKALNKYTSYGSVSGFSNTGNDTLILIIDGYIPVVFDYNGSGTWEPHEAEHKGNYTIKSSDGKDALETAGFILSYRNGSEKRFNRWGLLSEESDAYGNKTLYQRNAEQQLSVIESSTGQSLKFSYNGDRLVTKIELYDGSKNTGHFVAYTYNGKLLETVNDTDGDLSRFVYNSDKNLEKLIKSDGSFVEFKYGLTDKDGNLLTTQTINEEGHAERFDYDRTNRRTAYTDHDGVLTVYTYDENHRITEENHPDGSKVSYTYDGAGRTTSRTVNGSTTNYAYNVSGDLLETRYTDGSSEKYTYDEKGNCLSYKDRDGIVSEFAYNDKGSCTSIKKGGVEVLSATYNPKGFLTDIYKNGSHTSFSYDSRGNLTERRIGAASEKWIYDDQNRVLSYTDGENQKYTYSYTQKTVTEKTPAGLERTYTTNGRKDLISIAETDTITGEKRLFTYEYDKRHLVTAVKAGVSEQQLENVVSYTYTKAGKALTETRKDENSGWITEYVYDTAGRIESVKRSKTDKYGQAASQPITQKYAYSLTADGMDFTAISPEGNRTVVSYDRWNRVTDIKNALNENSQRSLSSGGRVLKEQSSHGGNYVYGYDRAGNLASLGEQGKKQVKATYNPDGSVKSVTDRLGNTTNYEYDELGLLKNEISPSATTVYNYDNIGRVKTVLVGSGSNITKNNCTQYVEYEYADNGRTVKLKYGGLYETTYTLNAWGEVSAVTDGMGNNRRYEYDSIGRTKAFYDGYGSKYEYAYNAVGKVSTLSAPDGSKKTYEYNELYLVTKAIDGEGVFFEGKYNRDGLLIAEKARPGVNKEYQYDKLGRIVEVKTGGEITERYSYTTKGRTVTFTDGKGSDYVYSYDEFGRLVSEKNRIDGIQNYTYNDNAEFAGKKDFEGNITEILFDERTRTEHTKYADGTENIIVYDECGNILSATNESGTLSYIYDKAGMLIKQTDSKTNETILYSYDKSGRRIRLASRNRDITYTYGKNSELIAQKDTKQNLAVSFVYDKCGRETERRFANGVVQKTRYDKAGRVAGIAQYAKNGNLISGEAYVYDETGRRTHTVNDKGLVTIYKYDNQSRLQTVFYPYNEDIKETARKEADKQGLYFLPSQGTPENYFLSSSEMVRLRAAAENLARARGNAITVNQVVWKESYTYDANGNRNSKTTAWGTIAYTYDKENCLIESGDLGKTESVKYTYDKNGNLLRESAARYRKDYVYNMQNRMIFSDVQDSVLNTRNITEYAYDAFGRRIETNQYLGDYTRNLYDGFSFDVIGKSVLQSAYAAIAPDQKYRTPTSISRQQASSGRNTVGTEIGTRYRYIDDNPLVPIPESGNSTNGSASANGAKTLSRPNSEYVLYSYGEPVAMSANGNASYFGTDILGSVRSVIDKYGAVQADYSYDAFGSPYLGNLENDIGFGYCGKVYDIGTGLYDYGFRDYSPVSARFTTVDPIRDGSNWFSYVVNDPVNYVDYLGLENSTLDVVKEFIADNFSGEVVNKTKAELYVRIENNKFDVTPVKFDSNFVKQTKETLSASVGKQIPIDGIVLPDGSVYKGWSGSKVTVVQNQDGSYGVNQSFGTVIANSILNIGIAILNAITTITGKNEKYEYYGFTNAKDVANSTKEDGIKGWVRSIRDGDPNYFNQSETNTGNSSSNSHRRGCTK